MHQATLWVLLALAGVPEVAAGPELADQAREVAAPVAQVTVYSDRARVRRRAEQALPAGIQALRLPDLPGAVLLDTLRLSCKEARVLRVEATPVERERTTIEQVEGLIVRLEQLTDRLALIDGEQQMIQLELRLLGAVQPQLPVAERERVGRPLPPLVPDAWKRVLDFLGQRKEQAFSRAATLTVERRGAAEELAEVQAEIERRDLGAFSERRVQVVALLEASAATTAHVELEYFIPGASWRPRYDLHYAADGGQIRLQIAGGVQQATGEDWTDVELELSTAIPGQGIELPELLTWALGEKREFVPQVRAARWPAKAELFALPESRPTPGEELRAARAELLGQRLDELQGLLGTDLDGDFSRVSGWTGETEGGDQNYGRGVGSLGAVAGKESRRSKARSAPAAPPAMMAPPPPASPAPMRAMKADKSMSYEADEELAAAEAPAEAAPAMADDLGGGLRSSTGGESAVGTSLKLFEPEAIDARVPVLTDPTLPALLAGGMDYVWVSPTRVTVPSTGAAQNVPLAVQTYPVTTFYEATPALEQVAYLRAEVRNSGSQPILGGPVNIFLGSDYAGQGELASTGPGGVLELPLGADEDIRLKRTVVPASETQGLISKEDVTTYTTTIEVGNYKKRPVKLAVLDVLPKSGHEKVEVEKVRITPAAVRVPDEDGVIRWEIELAAGQTQKLELVYRIRRPQNWQLRQ